MLHGGMGEVKSSLSPFFGVISDYSRRYSEANKALTINP
jgi:hypothetical protein